MLPRTPAANFEIIGRQHELAALRAALDAAIDGTAGVVLLAGEPGIGKTRLAEELAAEARAHGCRVLWGRCWDGEGAPAFWPWVQIIRTHVRDRDPAVLHAELGAGAAAIAQLVPEVHDLLPDLAPPPALEPARARFRLFDAIAAFLITIAQDRPLALILDDLHAADVPSLLLLRFLGQALPARPAAGSAMPRLLVLGAYRAGDVGRDHPLVQTLAELAYEPHVQRIEVGGLDDTDVARCITQTTGRSPAASVAAAIAHRTAGNPFFVIETARLLDTTRAEEESERASAAGEHPASTTPPRHADPRVTIPLTVRAVITRRLDRLSTACKDVVTLAAITGHAFSVGTLSAAGETPGGALLDALEEAESAGIITARPGAPGRYQFTHALVRDAFYEGIPAARRMRLHHQVGLALEARWGAGATDQLAEIAYHFVQSAPAGDVDRAVTYARRAGDHALAVYAHEEAARLYAMALATLQSHGATDEQSRCELALALGDARLRAGDLGAARESYQQAVDSARRLPADARDGEAAAFIARAALGMSMGADTYRPDTQLVKLLEEAADTLPPDDSALRARVLARLSVALITTNDTGERRAAISRDAVTMARRVGDRLALAAALHAWLVAAWQPENAGERLEAATEVAQLAEAAGNGELEFRGRGRRLAALIEMGDVATADLEIERCTRLSGALRQPYYHWAAAAIRSMRALLAGRIDEAERLIPEALALGSRAHASDAFGVYGLQLFALRRDQGRLAELAPLADQFIARFPTMVSVRSAVALTYADLGRVDEARGEFERLAAGDFTCLPRAEGWLVTVTQLAEVCALLGDTARAETLIALLQPYAGRCVAVGMGLGFNGAVSHYLGLLSATLGRWDEAAGHYAGALAVQTRMGARSRVARTSVAYAATLIAADQIGDGAGPREIDQARDLLLQARTIARELGMVGVQEESDRLLAVIDAWRPTPTRAADALPTPAAAAYRGGLTPREAEVLDLLTTGATNQEIADTLVVSVRTVERHLLHVYGKIGARRRSDAVAFALRQGAA